MKAGAVGPCAARARPAGGCRLYSVPQG